MNTTLATIYINTTSTTIVLVAALALLVTIWGLMSESTSRLAALACVVVALAGVACAWNAFTVVDSTIWTVAYGVLSFMAVCASARQIFGRAV